MMHSITNDRAKTDNGTKYTGIRILAVLFWIAIWQFASMYLKQEILLASPVSVVRKLFELIFSGNFWQSVGFSFVRIVTGFLLAVLLGIFLAVWAYWSKTVEILTAPVIAVVKSTPVASFIILCLIWIPSKNLSVFISFLMVLPVIYTNILEGIRQTDRKILEMAKVFRVNLRRQIRYIYVSQVLPYFLSACRISTASPLTVTTRSINGFPLITALWIPIKVSTLSTIHPASAGSMVELIARFVTA